MTKLAIPPVFLDKEKTILKAVESVHEASANNADLVVFTEAFIPGYPTWIWRLRPGGDFGLSEELHERLLSNSVSMDSNDLDPLYEAARELEVTIVCGIEERDSQLSQSNLYNSVVVIGAEGSLLNKHRKLMPTNPERMVWGFGDATGLKAVESAPCCAGRTTCLWPAMLCMHKAWKSISRQLTTVVRVG